MTRRGNRARVLRHVDAFAISTILLGMSRRQHQTNKSRKQQSAANANGIIPVVRHVAAPAPKQEQQATPAVIPVTQHQPAHVQEKAPASQRRPKTSVRRRGKTVESVVASVPVAAPHVPVQAIGQVEQLSAPVVAPAVPPPTPKRERPARAQRAARGRVKEPLRWAFSYADVAAAAGVSVDRVRHAACSVGGKEPRLVMTDLRSVARFIEERRHRAAA